MMIWISWLWRVINHVGIRGRHLKSRPYLLSLNQVRLRRTNPQRKSRGRSCLINCNRELPYLSIPLIPMRTRTRSIIRQQMGIWNLMKICHQSLMKRLDRKRSRSLISMCRANLSKPVLRNLISGMSVTSVILNNSSTLPLRKRPANPQTSSHTLSRTLPTQMSLNSLIPITQSSWMLEATRIVGNQLNQYRRRIQLIRAEIV